MLFYDVYIRNSITRKEFVLPNTGSNPESKAQSKIFLKIIIGDSGFEPW